LKPSPKKFGPLGPINGGGDEADAEAFVASVLTEAQIDAEVARLAALPLSVYESERVAAAGRLGFRASVLDKLVGAQRPQKLEPGSGTAIALARREPAAEPVDGSALLAGIVEQIGAPIFLPENEKVAAALWLVASHAFDAFWIFPRLRLKSPTAGCGKSTLLDIIECLVSKPLTPSNITGASLFRVIAEHRPTVLLDEADRYAKDNADLISVVNAGHKKNGTVVRCIGDDQEPRAFSVWAPMAIAAISSLTGTVEDRSIMVNMQRKPPGLKLERFRADRPSKALGILASQAARWAADNQIALSNADPKIPDALSNRAADNWLPLLAVAEIVGGDWPERAAKAAAAVTSKDGELKTQLLADIRQALTADEIDELYSGGLVTRLNELTDSPWPEINHGKPLTANRLARMLKDFGIEPVQIKIGGVNRRGYRREQFAAVFAAYLPDISAQAPNTPLATATTATAQKDNEKSAFQTATSAFGGSGLKVEIPEQQQNGSGCSGCEPPSGHVGSGNSNATVSCAHCGERDERPMHPQADGVLVHAECLAQYRPPAAEEESQDEW
jgi:Protein of unknown function (DUF3631)